MVSVHPEVFHDEGVVHVVWVMCRYGEVAKTHHLLGGVDDDRVVDAGPVRLWVLLQSQSLLCYRPSMSCVPVADLSERIIAELKQQQHTLLLRAAHLKPPQATNVIAAFEADRLQPFIQAALDAGQTRTTSTNNCYATSHTLVLCIRKRQQTSLNHFPL